MTLADREEAVRAVPSALSGIRGVRSVILFGSTARGTAREDSDVDLFIDCDRKAERAVWKVVLDLDSRFRVDFSPIFYRDEERGTFDTQFLESVLRHGRPLVGNLPTPCDTILATPCGRGHDGAWCNGSTPDFGSVDLGSNPGAPTSESQSRCSSSCWKANLLPSLPAHARRADGSSAKGPSDGM